MRAVVATALLLAVSAGAAAAAGPEAIVTADVRKGAVRPGSIVTVVVRIEDAAGVGSVPFEIVYDPSILELVSSRSVEGPFLRADGAQTSFLLAPGPGRAGTASVLVGHARLGRTAGASGRGVLCRLEFRARAPGVSPVSFRKAAVLDPGAAPLPARFVGGTITVRAAR